MSDGDEINLSAIGEGHDRFSRIPNRDFARYARLEALGEAIAQGLQFRTRGIFNNNSDWLADVLLSQMFLENSVGFIDRMRNS